MTSADHHKVWDIHSMLTPKPPELINSNRFFVREGELHIWDEKKRAKKKRFAFLFNDILLLTKKEGSKRYWLRVYITLRSPYVRVEDATNGFNSVFRLHCKTRSFTFFTLSPEQNKGWMEDLADSASGAHEKRATVVKAKTEKSPFDSGTKLESLKPIEDDGGDFVPVLAPPPQRTRSVSKGRQSTSFVSSPSGSSLVAAPAPTSPSGGGSGLLDEIMDFDYGKKSKGQLEAQPNAGLFASAGGLQPQPVAIQPAANPFAQPAAQSNPLMAQPSLFPAGGNPGLAPQQPNPFAGGGFLQQQVNPGFGAQPNPFAGRFGQPQQPNLQQMQMQQMQQLQQQQLAQVQLAAQHQAYLANLQQQQLQQQQFQLATAANNPFSAAYQAPASNFPVSQPTQPSLMATPEPAQPKAMANDPFGGLWSSAKSSPGLTSTNPTSSSSPYGTNGASAGSSANGFGGFQSSQQNPTSTPSSTFDLLI